METVLELVKQVGVSNTIVLGIFGGILYYLPKVINKHFEASEKSQDKFLVALKDTTDKHTEISDKFIESSEKHERDHQVIIRHLSENIKQSKEHDNKISEGIVILKEIKNKK